MEIPYANLYSQAVTKQQNMMLLFKIICAYIAKVKEISMSSKEIKNYLKRKRIYQWELARELHINEFTLSRWLRGSLSVEREEAVLKAIERLLEKRNDDEVCRE